MIQKLSQLILSFIIVLILSASIQSAEKKICHHCSEEIIKAPIKVNGYYFHNKHFICERCQSRIKGSTYYFENDKFYDDSCYQIIHLISCDHCNKEIKGRYTTYNGNNYHKECYNIVSFFPCAYCNTNITDSYITYENKSYHDSCYTNKVALRCSLCSEVINEDYIYDRYKNNYHASHKQDSKKCEYCGGYFDNTTQKKGISYLDGRGICLTCAEDAITEMSDVEPLLVEVNEMLKAYQLDIPLQKVSVHLVNKTELEELVHNTISNPQGFTIFYQEKNIFGMTLKRDINIYLLNGVPKLSIIKIIAHEFNHVWQGLHSPKDVEAPFCEGSCNYVAYLILQQYPDDYAFFLIDRLLEDSDPDYGEGFRRVVRFVKEQGYTAWMERLKKHNTFPSGY